MNSSTLIGIDFDNTIAAYDHVFMAAAVDRRMVSPGRCLTKREIRDTIRAMPRGDYLWQELQAEVYGPRMAEATMMEGVGEFMLACNDAGLKVVIVSHKTRYSSLGSSDVDLREKARQWMVANKLHDPNGYAVEQRDIYFESTREEKIERIRQLGCGVFIDDLVEVFENPKFPKAIQAFLYARGEKLLPTGPFQAFRSWGEIGNAVFAPIS